MFSKTFWGSLNWFLHHQNQPEMRYFSYSLDFQDYCQRPWQLSSWELIGVYTLMWQWGWSWGIWSAYILEVEPTFYNRFNVWHPGWWHLSVSSDLSDCVHEGTASWEGATLGVGAVAWIKESGFEYIKLERPINHRSQGTANLFCKELEDKYFSFVGHVISVVTI